MIIIICKDRGIDAAAWKSKSWIWATSPSSQVGVQRKQRTIFTYSWSTMSVKCNHAIISNKYLNCLEQHDVNDSENTGINWCKMLKEPEKCASSIYTHSKAHSSWIHQQPSALLKGHEHTKWSDDLKWWSATPLEQSSCHNTMGVTRKPDATGNHDTLYYSLRDNAISKQLNQCLHVFRQRFRTVFMRQIFDIEWHQPEKCAISNHMYSKAHTLCMQQLLSSILK